jgi:hypothetical protein
MPIEMALWRLNGNQPTPVGSSSLDTEKRLEEILENDISILGLDRLLVIGRQVPTTWGKFVDLLALDPQGDLYIIELKRDRTPREVVAQALDYGSWARDLDYEQLGDIYGAYKKGGDFEDALKDAFGEAVPDELNANHQLIIVASELDTSTERIVDYLTTFEVPINVVFFRYIKDGQIEYLARSWLASPAETETKTARKKRPWNGRDFYISFGEGDGRRWEDALKYGFVSGGGKKWHSQSLSQLQPGHRVFVHIGGQGYVGVGKVTESVKPVEEFEVPTNGTTAPILSAPDLKAPNMGHDLNDPDKREYLVRVEWERTHTRDEAFWEQGLFANQNTAAKLRDTHTIKRLEEHFGLNTSVE